MLDRTLNSYHLLYIWVAQGPIKSTATFYHECVFKSHSGKSPQSFPDNMHVTYCTYNIVNVASEVCMLVPNLYPSYIIARMSQYLMEHFYGIVTFGFR